MHACTNLVDRFGGSGLRGVRLHRTGGSRTDRSLQSSNNRYGGSLRANGYWLADPYRGTFRMLWGVPRVTLSSHCLLYLLNYYFCYPTLWRFCGLLLQGKGLLMNSLFTNPRNFDINCRTPYLHIDSQFFTIIGSIA